MNTTKQRIGLAAAGVLAAVSLWGCQATRNSDGSITITISPDIIITARGLEDALNQLNTILGQCLGGTRSCTDQERSDLLEAIENTLRRKEKVRRPDSPTGLGGLGS